MTTRIERLIRQLDNSTGPSYDAPGRPSARFTEVINDLADHAQVILWSLLEAAEAPVGDSIFVAPTWIDRTDLHPER
ncbi:hypothetical protein [Streptomyces sp. NPDC058326]|uniref:hypothetical protein n=1 Tax=Streptomyces sp. NPDC058326 TaxID=3346447 RepID=UPI0036EB6F51